jgi:dipeptidyl aminopeptidase/acylaminoacyl peptidase
MPGRATDVFYSTAEIDEDEETEVGSLWIVREGGLDRQFVYVASTDFRDPAPSPDGSRFAVVGVVDGVAQICLIDLVGDVTALTALPQGVTGPPVWSPDGAMIAFTAASGVSRKRGAPYRVNRATFRFDGVGYLDDAAHDLYVVDVDSGSVRQLTNDRCMNTDPRWSPDGRALCFLVSFPPEGVWKFLPELHVISIEGGEQHTVTGTWGGVFDAEWCSDDLIAFVGRPAADQHPFSEKLDVWVVESGGGIPECRTASILAGVGSHIQADSLPSGALGATRMRRDGASALISCQAGGDVAICRIALTGPEAVERVVELDGWSTYLMDYEPLEGILSLATSFVAPAELMLNGTRLTSLNDEVLEDVALPEVRKLDVTAPDGLRTEAWVLIPHGTRHPLPSVLYIHGGPYGAFGNVFTIDFQLLVGSGFAVIVQNFRGSGGYGTEFSRRIVGDWGQAGSLDHHAAVDAAIDAGFSDPERIGVCGYSHGAFATCWLVGTSTRFKAAVAENPITDFTSAFGAMDAEWIVEAEFGGPPHQLPETYRERSPLTHAANCATPLLFIVGEADLRCPATESEQYYRVLKANDVPTEIIRLPESAHLGTWHGPVAARLAQNEALINWFARHLGSPRMLRGHEAE